MTYRIEVHPEAEAEIDALPTHALQSLLEVFALLEVSPWSGRSVNEQASDAPLRHLPFAAGAGMATYLILEREQEVHLVTLVWAG